jgi:hypothetical protein
MSDINLALILTTTVHYNRRFIIWQEYFFLQIVKPVSKLRLIKAVSLIFVLTSAKSQCWQGFEDFIQSAKFFS